MIWTRHNLDAAVTGPKPKEKIVEQHKPERKFRPDRGHVTEGRANAGIVFHLRCPVIQAVARGSP